ncbi:MAG TPA: hypothetical protein VM571_04595 [Noviherbaspirillum sp.]|uniref:hypothetical protein n=1 Tax=Pseudoxanthomonas sp. CF125 TaxID=1855303 RepID=UPI00088B1E3C|nr:hypothetical protein [Pseudoxanthomonas sp. CF125]SDQ37850.1 hypothetical protein SAMN05216569_0890 [Pseudoxanthomonas sp. CF125]HVK93987.1 hypothetical protein [Noviherbaspirillum sp.]
MGKVASATLRVLGILWTLPNTLIGLIGGSVGLLFGASVQFSRRDFALVFHRWPWGPGGAITFGNTILHTGDTLDSECLTYEHRAGRCDHPRIKIGDHERAHVYQYMVLGPLFLPLYLLCGGVSVRNPFERAADRYAMTGRGWWP